MCLANTKEVNEAVSKKLVISSGMDTLINETFSRPNIGFLDNIILAQCLNALPEDLQTPHPYGILAQQVKKIHHSIVPTL